MNYLPPPQLMGSWAVSRILIVINNALVSIPIDLFLLGHVCKSFFKVND